MNFHKIPHTPTLNAALVKIQHPNTEIFENAVSALDRAKGLTDFLCEASILADGSTYPSLSYNGIIALADSLNREIQAVQLMLTEMGGFLTAYEKNKQA